MTTIEMLCVGAGCCLLVLALTIGPSFYPPGEGYAEERFYRRVSTVLMILGMALIASPLLWQIVAGR